MPLLGSFSSKRRSHTPTAAPPHQQSSLLSHLPLNQSSPAVFYATHAGSTMPNVHPRVNRSTDYHGASGSGAHHPRTSTPPPYDYMIAASPVPTPSVSWTSEIGMLADKIRDEASGASSFYAENLDRWSISQGMKLVAIAADEYDEGNETVALDIYLSGIDKILMALPNKTDARTKEALREKLTSVEERVGILNLAVQHKQKRQQKMGDDDSQKSLIGSLGLLRVTTSLATTITTMAATARGNGTPDASANDFARSPHPSSVTLSQPTVSSDAVYRFKQFGQTVISATVTLATMVKQSPLPDIVYFIFGYIVRILLWIDSQYHIMQKAQDLGIECVKFLLRVDEEYRLHEFATESIYMFVAAGLKAAVAYKEAPSFRQSTSAPDQPSIQYYDENKDLISPPPPTPDASSRSTWMWARWH